jgi:hypothetical protein
VIAGATGVVREVGGGAGAHAVNIGAYLSWLRFSLGGGSVAIQESYRGPSSVKAGGATDCMARFHDGAAFYHVGIQMAGDRSAPC